MKINFTSLFCLGFLFVAAKSYAVAPCLNNQAGVYSCLNIDLMSEINLTETGLVTFPVNVPENQKGGAFGSGVWGWTDSVNNREYALMGLNNKLAIVDITDAEKPVHLADLPSPTPASLWREVNVFGNYAVVVSESMGHGLQILDLQQLNGLARGQVHILKPSATYNNFGSSHTVYAHTEAGFLYALGSDTCDAGAHIVNMKNPLKPKFSGCLDRMVFEGRTNPFFDFFRLLRLVDPTHSDATYTHDMVCVIYKGPDQDYQGREICVASNDSTVNIVDVTNKSAPKQIATATHTPRGFIHQGWFTEDQRYFAVNDELDEIFNKTNMKTFFYDFSDLDNPKFKTAFDHGVSNIDHNHFVKGNYLYQANYNEGLTVLDLTLLKDDVVTIKGKFDTTPNISGPTFNGIWNVYPFFKSNNVIMSSIQDGKLYVVRPQW